MYNFSFKTFTWKFFIINVTFLIVVLVFLLKANSIKLFRASCSNGRKGYMGHLTVIMNEIINSKEKGPNREIIMSIFNGMNLMISIRCCFFKSIREVKTFILLMIVLMSKKWHFMIKFNQWSFQVGNTLRQQMTWHFMIKSNQWSFQVVCVYWPMGLKKETPYELFNL